LVLRRVHTVQFIGLLVFYDCSLSDCKHNPHCKSCDMIYNGDYVYSLTKNSHKRLLGLSHCKISVIVHDVVSLFASSGSATVYDLMDVE